MKETEMENYIYLCWGQIWAMTFWYHDPEEKRYRFEQLLLVLDKTKHYTNTYCVRQAMTT